MQRLEVSGAVRPIYGSLGVKRLRNYKLVVSMKVNNLHIAKGSFRSEVSLNARATNI